MSEAQLREAYTLMKQGDKQGAARLIQTVLKEDRSNQQAWWLFANVLDDEEKIVKSLEKVLTLNPEHPGARKRLAELRPEYAHFAENPNAGKEKPKATADATYWQKLDNQAKSREKNEANQLIAQTLFSGFGFRLLLFMVLVLFIVGFAIYFKFNNDQNYYDKNGDTPLTIGARFIEAIYGEDYVTAFALACEEYHPWIAEIREDYSTRYSPSEITVDLSQTEFSIFYQNGTLAFVKIDGITVIHYPASYFRIDWDEDADFEGIDLYGQHFRKNEEGVWQVCVEFSVPNLGMLDG